MGTATYIALATVALGSNASSVTFSSIPGNYRDLILFAVAKHDSSATNGGVFARFNSDSGSYPFVFIGSRPDGTFLSGTADINFVAIGRINNANNTPNITQIFDYAATDKHKTVLANGALSAGVGGAISQVVFANRWPNTAAVTSITLTTELATGFASGSTFSLYGIGA